MQNIIGVILYLKTDIDQEPVIVTGIRPTPTGNVLYIVSKGAITSEHYDFELQVEKNILITTNA